MSEQEEEFVVSEGTDFEPPPAGIHDAVCVDLYTKKVRNAFKLDNAGQPTVEDRTILAWEINALMEDGRRYVAYKVYRPSLHARSNLRADLRGWRGKEFTDEELKGFNLAKVLGAPCRLVIQHAPRNGGGVNAKVVTVSPADPAKKLTPTGKYVRHRDREQQQAGGGAQQQMPHNGYAPPAGQTGTTQQPAADNDKPPF